MIRLLALYLALLGCLSAQDTRRMTEVVAAHAANDKFMGSILVSRDGSIVFEKSHGLVNAEWNIPNSSTTKFRLGSVTKQFTAAAILLLEERGKLTLEDTVSKHVPDAPAAWANITILHLLSHTSGIPKFHKPARLSHVETQCRRRRTNRAILPRSPARIPSR